MPTRRCSLLTGRCSPNCLEPFWLFGILHPSGHLAPSWLFRPPGPLGVLLAPGALVDTRCRLITCCPPSCSAASFRLGPSKPLGSVLNTQHPPGSPSNTLQATRLRAEHSASSWQPIQYPPGCPALPWLFGHLLVARYTGRSMSSWPLSASVPLAAQRTPGHSTGGVP